jgi:oligopeptide transport system permease protein
MWNYTLRRLRGVLPTIATVLVVTFFVARLAPGGPFDTERVLAPEVKANLIHQYGLDAPLLSQFWSYLNGLAHGELGSSLSERDFRVDELLGAGLPVSLMLGGYALLLALVVGVSLGVWSSVRPGGTVDRIVGLMALIAIAVPPFVLGPSLALIVGVWLRWLPAAGWEPNRPADLVLPVLTLATPAIGEVARLCRASMLTVRVSTHVRTAVAKGLSEWSILIRHVLPLALAPVLGLLGPTAAGLLGGSLVVESVFGIPGMGRYLVQGALNRDYPLVLGKVLVFSGLVVLFNLLADLAQAGLDPRVRDRDQS